MQCYVQAFFFFFFFFFTVVFGGSCASSPFQNFWNVFLSCWLNNQKRDNVYEPDYELSQAAT